MLRLKLNHGSKRGSWNLTLSMQIIMKQRSRKYLHKHTNSLILSAPFWRIFPSLFIIPILMKYQLAFKMALTCKEYFKESPLLHLCSTCISIAPAGHNLEGFHCKACVLHAPQCHRLYMIKRGSTVKPVHYSISQEICTRFLLCCALLWLYIDWFSHIHQAYLTGTVAI